jgi:hypothetical protein
MGKLADTVDDLSDYVAELVANGLFPNARIFNYVVQHGSHQALMIHVHIGENAGDFQRV